MFDPENAAVGEFKITEVAFVPIRTKLDRLLWRFARYRDLYWDAMELRASRGNTVINVDRDNHQILIEVKETHDV